jgi:hypothetical protein
MRSLKSSLTVFGLILLLLFACDPQNSDSPSTTPNIENQEVSSTAFDIKNKIIGRLENMFPKGIRILWEVNTRDGLRLRNKPNGERLLLLPYKAIVTQISPKSEEYRETIDGIDGYWIEVDYSGSVGWCFDGYLDKSIYTVEGINTDNKLQSIDVPSSNEFALAAEQNVIVNLIPASPGNSVAAYLSDDNSKYLTNNNNLFQLKAMNNHRIIGEREMDDLNIRAFIYDGDHTVYFVIQKLEDTVIASVNLLNNTFDEFLDLDLRSNSANRLDFELRINTNFNILAIYEHFYGNLNGKSDYTIFDLGLNEVLHKDSISNSTHDEPLVEGIAEDEMAYCIWDQVLNRMHVLSLGEVKAKTEFSADEFTTPEVYENGDWTFSRGDLQGKGDPLVSVQSNIRVMKRVNNIPSNTELILEDAIITGYGLVSIDSDLNNDWFFLRQWTSEGLAATRKFSSDNVERLQLFTKDDLSFLLVKSVSKNTPSRIHRLELFNVETGIQVFALEYHGNQLVEINEEKTGFFINRNWYQEKPVLDGNYPENDIWPAMNLDIYFVPLFEPGLDKVGTMVYPESKNELRAVEGFFVVNDRYYVQALIDSSNTTNFGEERYYDLDPRFGPSENFSVRYYEWVITDFGQLTAVQSSNNSIPGPFLESVNFQTSSPKSVRDLTVTMNRGVIELVNNADNTVQQFITTNENSFVVIHHNKIISNTDYETILITN